jgi:hypothetical protein
MFLPTQTHPNPARTPLPPSLGYATPFWWHGHEYPTFHVGPCTVLNFGPIQSNQNIVFTSKIGYENCGGEPDRKALLPSEDAVVGLYGIGENGSEWGGGIGRRDDHEDDHEDDQNDDGEDEKDINSDDECESQH